MSDLHAIASQIRALADTPAPYSLDMAGRLVQEALKLGAFPGIEYFQFRQRFNPEWYRFPVRPDRMLEQGIQVLAETGKVPGGKYFLPGATVAGPRFLRENFPPLADLIENQGEDATTPRVHPQAGKLSPRDLADKYLVPFGALRKRLNRWRYEHDAGYSEVSNAAKNEPKFLYDESAVMPVIDALKRAADGQQKKI